LPRILFVEDESSLRENLSELLQAEGFDMRTAANGALGLSIAQREIPDLILCDVMMPVMDGFTLAERLRAQPLTAHIPIIFLTAKDEKSDIRTGLDLGVEDYLTKPCPVDKMAEVIRMRLAKRQLIEERLTQSWRRLRQEVINDTPPAIASRLEAIIGYAEVISTHCHSLDPDTVGRTAHDIVTTGIQLRRLLSNFTLHFELSSLPAGATPAILRGDSVVSADKALRAIAEKCSSEFGRRADLVVKLAPAALAIADRAFEKIATELIDNAFRYSRPQSLVVVEAAVDERQYRIAVRDAGPGITATRLAQIREEHDYSLDTPNLELGLPLAIRLLRFFHEELNIQTKPLEGTSVGFSLPLP
jgi:DNA-binding response OmpR family regulator/anti-sigma regulatory factor (Ser/Thr protein kinase)